MKELKMGGLFLQFLQCIPIHYFAFSKSMSTRHHQMIKKTWYHLTPHGLLYLIPPEKILYLPWKWRDGTIQLEHVFREIFVIYFALCKLSIIVVCCKSTSTSQFKINLNLVSSCRGALCICNGGRTNFIAPPEHKLCKLPPIATVH